MAEALIDIKNRFRRDLVDELGKELLGPSGGPEELLSERPSQRYLVGRLAPFGILVGQDEDDGAGDVAADDEHAEAGYGTPISMSMNPSSIGLTFLVGGEVEFVPVAVRWGQYFHESGSGPIVETGAEDDDQVPAGGTGYRRKQVEHLFEVPVGAEGLQRVELEPGVNLETLAKMRADGSRAVSVFLVNRRKSANPEMPEEDEWLFQPEVVVDSNNGAIAFKARRLEDGAVMQDPDLVSMELLYWSRPEFAVGHGCAVDWHSDGAGDSPLAIRTTVIPEYELPRIDPRDDVDAELDMRVLGGAGYSGVEAAELVEMLQPLANAYGDWIETELAPKLDQVDDLLRSRAEDHISDCRRGLSRIQAGIDLLMNDEETRLSFCFAMRAMAKQREQSVKSLARRRGEKVPLNVTVRWRPFQLAFILLNLPAMADRKSTERDIADLLWFPTGGGKTEAYLGLTAFALAHRRIRKPLVGYRNDGGVSVLMRYTLRLLTIQQFQRATTLICACDQLRIEEGNWGSEVFSIGLWVGGDATPNAFSDTFRNSGAVQALERIRNGHKPRKGSPVQLLSCPWCGTKLDPTKDYQEDADTERLHIWCSDSDCPYSKTSSLDGIPTRVFDTEVYRFPPSLLIATVDKFARMPFKGEVQSLFGRVESECPRHGFLCGGESHARKHNKTAAHPKVEVTETMPFEPPDLIIQDELHLISGPLGTLVGLYETAVDLLCSVKIDGEWIGPKVVASTATIRRAHDQIIRLFNRRLQVFPPSGISASDSWFGKEIPTSDEPGRLYIGVSAPGKSVKTALIRVYAAMLSRAKALHLEDAVAGDPYMTLVGYFNSLRELGGAIRLIEDDVPSRIKVLSRRDKEHWPKRNLYVREELTSNKKAEEVPEILGMLERVHTAGDPTSGAYPVDTLFASNMISVGVDIDRLGLMVVNGQPKSTSEYIQATSRVGRQSPGLVITVFNWTRPRDISHYERFRSYHSALYKFVEASSVTPFSSRARDKGLEGVLTSILRLGSIDSSGQKQAGNFDRTESRVDEAVAFVSDRAKAVAGDQESIDAVAEAMQDLDLWEAIAEPDQLVYTRFGLGVPRKGEPPSTKRYLLGEQEMNEHEGVFTAPGSLREVETEIPVFLKLGGSDD